MPLDQYPADLTILTSPESVFKLKDQLFEGTKAKSFNGKTLLRG
ncbi:hypothetical protein ABEG64_12330 [Erwinia amylovora]|nr:hypothetical protein [Erwinia amylovora]